MLAHWSGQVKPCHDRSEQSRKLILGQVSPGQVRSGQVRSGQVRSGHVPGLPDVRQLLATEFPRLSARVERHCLQLVEAGRHKQVSVGQCSIITFQLGVGMTIS